MLPRFADHGRDLAALSALGSSVGVFVLDFKHAFMTIPLSDKEMAYNTSIVPESIRRNRPPIDEEEPETGTILVWRVFGVWWSHQPFGVLSRGDVRGQKWAGAPPTRHGSIFDSAWSCSAIRGRSSCGVSWE